MLNMFNNKGEQKTLLEEKDIEFTGQYLKLPNGFMMLYMDVHLEAGIESGIFDFPVPFKQVYRTFALHSWASETYGYAATGRNTPTSIEVWLRDLSHGISLGRNGIVVVIGRWK